LLKCLAIADKTSVQNEELGAAGQRKVRPCASVAMLQPHLFVNCQSLTGLVQPWSEASAWLVPGGLRT
jgi:hypothetical protein